MSAFVGITCDCTERCIEAVFADDAHTRTEARVIAHRKGWTADVVGGNTIDLAPGHTWERAA